MAKIRNIIIVLVLLISLFISGCNNSFFEECNEGKPRGERIVCPIDEEIRLEVIGLFNCHKEICNNQNLSIYVYNEIDECSCIASFAFIDEQTGSFINPIDKNHMVKCWNKTNNKVSIYHFDNVLNECEEIKLEEDKDEN